MLLNKVCGLVVYTLPREKGGGGGGGGGAVFPYCKGGGVFAMNLQFQKHP